MRFSHVDDFAIEECNVAACNDVIADALLFKIILCTSCALIMWCEVHIKDRIMRMFKLF